MPENTNLQNLLDIQPQKNMSDKIFEQISALIRSGELKEGYVFPNEAVMCEQLSIGRSTIREAYKALELSGYVTRSKRGTVVNGQAAILRATPLKTMVGQSSDQDFLEFRLMLEGQTAFLAALRATNEDLKQLKSTQIRLQAAASEGDCEKMAALDKQFHEEIAAASHNLLMITAMAAVADAWESETKKNFFHIAKTNSDTLREIIGDHQEILAAIENRDPETAKERIIAHISHVSV